MFPLISTPTEQVVLVLHQIYQNIFYWWKHKKVEVHWDIHLYKPFIVLNLIQQ